MFEYDEEPERKWEKWVDNLFEDHPEIKGKKLLLNLNEEDKKLHVSVATDNLWHLVQSTEVTEEEIPIIQKLLMEMNIVTEFRGKLSA